jgi:hypothetical protein
LVPIAVAARQARIPVCSRTVASWIAKGRIPGHRIAGRYFVDRRTAESLQAGSF